MTDILAAISIALYSMSYYFSPLISLASGLLIPPYTLDKPEPNEDGSVFRRLSIVGALLGFVLGTVATWSIPIVVDLFFLLRGLKTIPLHYPTWLGWLNIAMLFLGIAGHIMIRRAVTPWVEKLRTKATKGSDMVRDTRTDVRTVRELLPKTDHYDPMEFIDLHKGIFVGLDINQHPQYLPLSDWRKQHADIIGTTGAGKGVASGILLYQSILAGKYEHDAIERNLEPTIVGEGVFVLDPKNDEWAPHLYRKACEDAGKPFYLIDLNRDDPQLDLLKGITPQHLEELLVAGFSLSEKGDNADFYRIDDRKAARVAPRNADEEELRSLKNLFESDYVQSIQNDIKAFYGKLEELSLVNSINAIGGVDLQEIFEQGGCCYIVGSMRNAKIIAAQRMILIRLYQLAELRDRVSGTPRPIAIFLDELKYHLSKPALEGLGAARDKGVHIIMAHQSLADLKDCPADLDGDAVVGAVVENAKFKLVYKLQDPDTAEWVAKMSGTILVDDESKRVELTKTLNEVVEGNRMIRQAERQYVDTNMLQNLPDFVSYIFTSKDIPKPSLISPIKVKKQPLVYAICENGIPPSQDSSLSFHEVPDIELATDAPSTSAAPAREKAMRKTASSSPNASYSSADMDELDDLVNDIVNVTPSVKDTTKPENDDPISHDEAHDLEGQSALDTALSFEDEPSTPSQGVSRRLTDADQYG